jgi:hypothetical protein
MGPASLTLALLAWLAAAVHIVLSVASHETTVQCIVDQNLVNAAFLALVTGSLLSVAAVVAGQSGSRRARGVYRVLAIAGLAMGALCLLACGFELSHTLSPHAVSPVYRHPC